MKLGIGTYAYMWSIGFPGAEPKAPMRAIDLVRKAHEFGLRVVQFGSNLALYELDPGELDEVLSACSEWGSRSAHAPGSTSAYSASPTRECAGLRPTAPASRSSKPGVDPAVSRDGRTIVFARNLTGGHCLFRMETDGTGLRQLTHKESPWASVHASWMPDGSGILYADCADGALELFRCDPEGRGAVQLTHSGPGRASTSPAASPDMRWIAFRRCDEIFWRKPQASERAYRESRADKRPVWIMGIDGSDPRVIEPLHYQISIDGGRRCWRRLLTR